MICGAGVGSGLGSGVGVGVGVGDGDGVGVGIATEPLEPSEQEISTTLPLANNKAISLLLVFDLFIPPSPNWNPRLVAGYSDMGKPPAIRMHRWVLRQ